MREIKFRTWDKKYHMMEYDYSTDLLIGMDGKAYQKEERNYAGTTFVEYELANHYEIMQYTGLKDKNGKEIYEGDIVRISGHPFGIDGNYEVGYNELMELCCGGWYLHRMRHWAEVIGNIYENPELLEESK